MHRSAVWGLVVAAGGCAATAAARDRIHVVGSSTVFPFTAVVAETYARSTGAKAPLVESTGTGGGFRLFCRGAGTDTPDINSASRPMTDGERAECGRHGVDEVLELRIGTDGVAIASSTRAPPLDLTRAQLYRALAKTLPVRGRWIANPNRLWSDVDPALPHRAIAVIGPAPNHGTRDAFAALVLTPPCVAQPELAAQPAARRRVLCEALREDGAWTDVTQDYASLVARLYNDPDTVGVLSYSYVERNHDQLRAARIDGVAPTQESIGAWRYPVARPLFLYVKRSHVAAIPGLAAFVQEFVSDRAAGRDGYLVDHGLAPTPEADLAAQRARAAALTPRAPPAPAGGVPSR